MKIKYLFVILLLPASIFVAYTFTPIVSSAVKLAEIKKSVSPALEKQLTEKDLESGKPIFIRIFKESAELEVWVREESEEKYSLFKTYPICYYSGNLGPKLKTGDRQSPERVLLC